MAIEDTNLAIEGYSLRGQTAAPNSFVSNQFFDTEDQEWSKADIFTKGVPAAAVSGILGFVNTALQFSSANMVNSFLGRPTLRIDEEEAVGTVFGKSTQEYYRDYKTQIDAGGFIASMFVPFGAAAKITKTMASRGILGEGAQVASGMRNADYMLGTQAVESAIKDALLSDAAKLFSKDTIKAYATTSKLVATEFALGESLMALSMNQNAFLNPEGLGYLDSAYNILKESVTSPLTWGGMGVYGAVQNLRVSGLIKTAFKEKDLEAQKIIAPLLSSMEAVTHANPGDALVITKRATMEVSELAIDATNTQAVNKKSQVLHELSGQTITAMSKLNPEGYKPLGKALEKIISDPNADLDEIASTFSYIVDIKPMKGVNAGKSAADNKAFNSALGYINDTYKKAAAARSSDERLVAVAEGDALFSLVQLKNLRKLDDAKMMQFLERAENSGLLDELIDTSYKLRRPDWDRTLGATGIPSISALKKEMRAGNIDADYIRHLRLQENIVDIPWVIANNVGIKAGKALSPRIAHIMERHADNEAFAGIWQNTKMYINMRTLEARDNILPGLSDIAKSIERKAGGMDVVMHDGNRLQFAAQKGFFKKLNEMPTKRFNFFRAEAQWAHAKGMKAKEFGKGIDEWDLAKLEKLAIMGGDDFTVRWAGTLRGQQFSAEIGSDMAKKILVEKKRELYNKMARNTNYKEEELAKILNIPDDPAMRASDDFEAWSIMDKKNYTEPDWYEARVGKINTDITENGLRSEFAVAQRMDIRNKHLQEAAAETLGDDYLKLSELPPDLLGEITRLDSRAAPLKGARTEYGSLRDWIAAQGKKVRDFISSRSQKLEDRAAVLSQSINHVNAREDRLQLSIVRQMLEKDWWTLRTTPEGERVMMRKEVADAGEKVEAMIAKGGGKFPEIDGDTEALYDTYRDIMASSRETFNPEIYGGDALFPTKTVAAVLDAHMEIGQRQSRGFSVIADSRGKSFNHHDDVLFPIHKDLSTWKHISFIKPVKEDGGSKLAEGVLTARTQEELLQKENLVRQKYGNAYRIINNKDKVGDYKRMLGEAKEGKWGDSYEFDSFSKRKFKWQEIVPEADLGRSQTLADMLSWWQRREKSLVLASVDNKYANLVDYLSTMDKAYGSAIRATDYTARRKMKNTIYADSLNLLRAGEVFSGPGLEGFRQASAWVDEMASAGINAVGGIFSSLSKRNVLTADDLEKVNKALEDAKIVGKGESPYENVVTLALANPKYKDNRVFNTMVRTVNNLSSLTLLTMDTAYAITNLISTPILLSPVLREAKQFLRGTERGEMLDALTSVNVPGGANGVIKEPTAMKLILGAVKRYWTPEGKAFAEKLRSEGILTDYMLQYREAHDFAGAGMGQLAKKIENFRSFIGKYNGYQFGEDLSRFMVAHSVEEIAKLRGIRNEREIIDLISSTIDKVHGVHRMHQRPQIFNGTTGQAIGLFQSYSFNWMHNALKFVQDGDLKQSAILAGMQSGIFGIRSLPGFRELNSAIGNSNRNNEDIYSLTGADDPDSWSQYLLYGMGSHALIYPLDFFNRGDMNPRNPLFLPIQFDEEGNFGVQIPGVNVIVKAMKNIWNTGALIANTEVPISQALVHGIAHNGLNRPLENLANIYQNMATSAKGTANFVNINYIDRDLSKAVDVGSIIGRALGVKPLNESILMDTVYRNKAYQAETRRQVESIGEEVRLTVQSGAALTSDVMSNFARKYERVGGNIENFNAFYSRAFQGATEPQIDSWYREVQEDTELGRLQNRLMMERSSTPVWAE